MRIAEHDEWVIAQDRIEELENKVERLRARVRLLEDALLQDGFDLAALEGKA